ncbi:MAG: response regulator [Desulfobacteraceae bacterium]|nr:response regulator [Desulfobacteraceae bacterium]
MDTSFVILIVDDSNTLRNLIRKSLESSGFNNIMEAVDGKDALDSLLQHKIDLIISDINMPKVNGVELLKAVLNHSALKKIPFVVLTSETEDETFKKIMQMGATDFIKKPFSKQDLITKIQSIIEWS